MPICKNLRLEEKRDCIYRLPPPGNGRPPKSRSRQSRISEFFTSEPNIIHKQSQANSNQTINILQWNAEILTSTKAIELSEYALESEIDVICISELGHRRQLEQYRVIDASDVFSQSAILVRDNLPSKRLEYQIMNKYISIRDPGHEQTYYILTQAAEIDTKFVVIHTYIHPSTPKAVRRDYWTDLEQLVISKLDQPYIIVGDLNTKDRLFSSNHEENHLYIREFITRNKIVVLNTGEPTRELNTLDISMCSAEFDDNTIMWEVQEDLSSDHLPCVTRTLYKSSTKRRRIQYKVVEINDIKASVQALGDLLQAYRTRNQPIDLETFARLSRRSLTTKKIRNDFKTYWNRNLTKARNTKNRARHKLIKAKKRHSSRLNEYENAYKKAKTEFKKLIRKSQNDKKEKDLTEAANDKTGKKGWQAFYAVRPDARKRRRKWKTHQILNQEESNQIAQEFASISNSVDQTASSEEIEQYKTILQHHRENNSCQPVTARELKSAIIKAKTKSAPGSDMISTKFLKAAAENQLIFDCLLEAINDSIQSGKFPDILKQAKVIPLPKPKKGHRPISLLSTIGKTVERIVEKRLRRAVRDKFHPAQFGCRSSHSTSHAINRLLHRSGLAAAQSKQFGAIAFDFSKAYDRVIHHKLIIKLHEMQAPGYLILFVDNWLSNRSFVVHHRQTKSDTQQMKSGIPQGSSLSVLLWLIFINDITLEPDCCNLYVDDSLIMATGDTIQQVNRQLQQLANKVVDWCQDNKVLINYDKTHLIYNEWRPYQRIILKSGVSLVPEQDITYLGVKFATNSSMVRNSLQVDLTEAAVNIKKRCYVLRSLRKYNVDQKLLERLGAGFVEGKLRYYTSFLGAEMHTPLIPFFRPLKIAYNEYLRVLSGAFRSTPIPILHAATRKPTLTQLIEADQTKLVLSSVAHDNLLGREYFEWDGSYDGWSPLGTAWKVQRHISENPMVDTTNICSRVLPTRDHLEKLSNCMFPITLTRDKAFQKHNENKLIPTDSDIELWTDGSYRPSLYAGGAGIVTKHYRDNRQYETFHHTFRLINVSSSYETERQAIKYALQETANAKPLGKTINIFTDSASVLAQMRALQYKPKHVDYDITAMLESISKLVADSNIIRFIFVPAHSDINDNEVADTLAKEACTTGQPTNCDTTFRTYKQLIRKRQKVQLDQYLDQNVKPSRLCGDYPSRKPFKGQPISQLQRGKPFWPYKGRTHTIDRNLLRAQTGHTRTRDHLFSLGIVKDPICKHCKATEETLYHLSMECESLLEQTTEENQERLRESRTEISELMKRQHHHELPQNKFNELLWLAPSQMKRLLRRIKSSGQTI